jgi:hypothetical protein
MHPKRRRSASTTTPAQDKEAAAIAAQRKEARQDARRLLRNAVEGHLTDAALDDALGDTIVDSVLNGRDEYAERYLTLNMSPLLAGSEHTPGSAPMPPTDEPTRCAMSKLRYSLTLLQKSFAEVFFNVRILRERAAQIEQQQPAQATPTVVIE